jgi:type I restriction enzyme S subunit
METEIIQKKEIMRVPKLRFGEFSEDWKKIKLGDIGQFKGGGTPDTKIEKYWNGEIPWISSSDIYDGDIHNINIHKWINKEAVKDTATKIIPKESILLISRVGVGKLAINKHEICTSQDFSNFLPFKDNSYFIGYFLIARKNVLLSFAQGTSIKGFTTSDIKSLKFYLPSLPEQQKIATFLSAIDKKIQQLIRKKELLETYKKGVMQQLFSQKLRFKPALNGAEGNENGKDFAEWKVKRLGEICTFFSGGTPTSTNQKFYSGTIPFIGSGNIYDHEVYNFITEEALNNSSAKIVEKGDLLYALYGANSGEVSISKLSGAINQAILCIRTEECIAYIYYILLHNKGKIITKYLQGGQGNLSANIIKKLKYSFPSLKEQQKIADFLSEIDIKIEAVSQQITQTQSFKKGLLQQMFV